MVEPPTEWREKEREKEIERKRTRKRVRGKGTEKVKEKRERGRVGQGAAHGVRLSSPGRARRSKRRVMGDKGRAVQINVVIITPRQET